MFSFYNTGVISFNNFSLFSAGIIISSTFLEFSLNYMFLFHSFVLFQISYCVCNFIFYKFTCCFTCFMDYFLEAVFKAYSPVSNNCFLYFLENDKNPYPLTYFLVLGSIENRAISVY